MAHGPTLKQVNAAIAKARIPLTLERVSDGYHLFIHDRPEANIYETESEMVPYTSNYSLQAWVRYAEYAWNVISKRIEGRVA